MQRRHFNGLKTAALFGLLWAVLLALGGMLAGGRFLWLFAIGGLIGTFVTYWYSDRIAIASMQAVEVSAAQAPVLHQIVGELSERAQAPMPRIYVSPSPSPNAFATGRSPQHAAVCVTGGILQILDARELRGVLGHELMHVYNRDILTSSVAAAIAGLISSVAQMALWFGGLFRGRDGDGPNPIAILLTAILAPIGASLIQLAISRTREYDADEDGAALTGDPVALASALRKLEQGTSVRPLEPTPQRESAAHMMIANPFRGGGVSKLFATHPPMGERIARLETQARAMGQWGGPAQR